MRFYPLLLTLILLASCGINTAKDDSDVSNAVMNMDTITPMPKANPEDPYADIYAWQGNLDGQYSVIMWYKEFDDVIVGSLFYTDNKKAKPIQLIGTKGNDSNTRRLLEMWPDGNITGVWDLKLHPVAAEGTWVAPKTGKRFNASLMHIDTAVTIKAIDSVGDVSGEYKYRYFEDGGWGTMIAKQQGNLVVVSFDNITQAPANNLAILDNVTLPLNNNVAIYKSSEYGECAFRIRFFKGFAVVDYINDKYECGFGNGASVDGIYVKAK